MMLYLFGARLFKFRQFKFLNKILRATTQKSVTFEKKSSRFN